MSDSELTFKAFMRNQSFSRHSMISIFCAIIVDSLITLWFLSMIFGGLVIQDFPMILKILFGLQI